MNNSFNSKYVIISFVKNLQKDGMKESSELVFRSMLSILKKKIKKKPLFFFRQIIDKSKPFCEIRSVRISGTNYKIPIEIKPLRQKVLLLKWIILNSFRIKMPLSDSLVKELIDTYNLVSVTVKMCDELHRTAESNKIYIQFR